MVLDMTSTQGATLSILVTKGVQEWEWTNFKTRWQPKKSLDIQMHHPDLISYSMSRTLQKARAHNVTFCNFEEKSQKLNQKEYHGSPKGSPKMGCPSQFHRYSIVFLWCSTGFQKVAYGISMEFQWCFKGIPLDSYGVSPGILWDVHDMSDISIKFWWYFFEMTIRFQKDPYGNWQGFL